MPPRKEFNGYSERQDTVRSSAPPAPVGAATATILAVSEPQTPFQPLQALQSLPDTTAPVPYFSSLSVIGQFHSEYILCQSGTDLVIIDQHAASERVAYQRLKQQYLSGGVESQRLLFPETLELTFSEVAAAQRFQVELAGIGFELEPFGGATMMVSAVPRLAERGNAIGLVREIVSDLAQLGTSAAFQELLDGLLARIACHSVVRGIHQLEGRQISELLRSMDETEFAASCPHGRPVSHVITLADLEKIFKRT